MKILQTSDNHLGETAYSRIDSSTGLNARGLDFLNSFKNIAEIALNQHVNVFLIVGDFFTRVNPHPRYILEVMKTVRKLSKAGMTTVFVSGNHETPRMMTTLNPLILLEQIDNVHAIVEPKTLTIDGIDFVCVPTPPNFDHIKDLFNPMLDVALKDSKSNTKILATHLPLSQAVTSSEKMLETFIGECVDVKQIPKKFAYVALGHMHKFQRIPHESTPICYSGSSERYEFNEEYDDKYAILIEIGGETKVIPIKLSARNMLTIVDADCSGLPATKITRLVLDAIEKNKDKIKDSLVRVKLENIDIDEYRLIQWDSIRERLDEYEAFDLRLQPRTVVSLPAQEKLEGEYVLPPSKELELYVKRKKEYEGIREKLLKLGNEVINESKEIVQSET